ncbi:hypothetical protein ED733_003851 [Metarhizium rileyi]|uniref:SNF2-related protein n=1 Tax=Metarhizium rileyi (strain RCEF 4871) TaxID=1649241 RepID=A0A5C6GLR9_METRR|nr:hypothetical protein ED733_003851 [Metarhizium rileyi]
MLKHHIEAKHEAETVAAATLLDFCFQRLPDDNEAEKPQAWMQDAVIAEVCTAQRTNEIQVKIEPDVVGESDYDKTLQNKRLDNSQSNSEEAQDRNIKQEQISHEQTASGCVIKEIVPRYTKTTAERILQSDGDEHQDGDSDACMESLSGYLSDEYIDIETDSESGSDLEGSKERSSKTAGPAAEKTSKKRAPIARTAREFIARLHQKEDEAVERRQGQNQKKRTAGDHISRPSKQSKTSNANCGSDMLASLTHDFIGESNDCESVAPAMPTINAHTHRKQFALLKDSIPEKADTRRTRTQKRDLAEAVKLFGYKKVKACSGQWLLKGMTTALYGHQINAAAWMVKKECARAGPLGGLIADEMGIGKTITSLACVVGNLAEEEDLKTYIKGTLVIVPNLEIARQWLSEANKHCGDVIKKSVIIYQSRNKIPAAIYQTQMMVITTAKEVLGYYQRDLKRKEKRKPQRESEPGEGDLDEVALDDNGIFGFNWYRIILDEAHSIKNLKSLTKQSMCELKAKHRWALTGTPLSNAAFEFIPYLQFIGFDVAGCKKSFREEFMDSENKANDRFETLISSFMYRRTQRDTFLGHAIIPIPPRETHDIWVPLTFEEEAIYKFLDSLYSSEDDAQSDGEDDEHGKCGETESNKPKDDSGDVRKKSIRRSKRIYMRRLISHPYNIERLLRRLEKDVQIQELRDQIQKRGGSQTVLQQILADSTARSTLERYASGLAELSKFTQTVFGGLFKFDAHLTAIQIGLQFKDMECSKCESADPASPMMLSECRHLYCASCYLSMLQALKFCEQPNLTQRTCIVEKCNALLIAAINVPTMSSIVETTLSSKAYSPLDIDTNKVILSRDKDQMGCFIMSTISQELSMIPNSRLTTAMIVLLSWRIDYPDDKIIVFSENVTTAKVLGCMLNIARIGFVYYYGCMSPDKKTRALQKFRDCPQTHVFLAGLKSGGQSLNITCANRVIIVDPWWNVTSELQAAGRTSRIGQKKTCYVVRIFTSGTEDERVAELQKSKSEEVDYALQDDGHVPQMLDDKGCRELFRKVQAKA